MRAVVVSGLAAAALSTAVVASCSSGPSSGPASVGPTTASSAPAVDRSFNAVDVSFARQAVVLGDQARQLAEVLRQADPGHDSAHAEHVALAKQLDAQGQEAAALRALLTAWGAPITGPRTGRGGELDPEHMRELAASLARGADRDWVEHVSANRAALGAVCRNELDHGSNPTARHLAEVGMAPLAPLRPHLLTPHPTASQPAPAAPTSRPRGTPTVPTHHPEPTHPKGSGTGQRGDTTHRSPVPTTGAHHDEPSHATPTTPPGTTMPGRDMTHHSETGIPRPQPMPTQGHHEPGED